MKRPMRCFRSAKTCSRTQPGLPLKKGRGATMMTHDYKRNGATTLFAALLWFGHRLAGRRAEMNLRDRPCPWRSSLIDTPCPPRPMKRCRSCPADRPPGSRPSYRAASVAVQVRMVPAISASMAVVAIDGDGGLHHDHGRAIRALLSTLALQCPTLVAVLPAQSGRVGRPCIGKAACLQGILPGVRGAPARSLDNGGVDRPVAYGRIAPFLEMRVKPGDSASTAFAPVRCLRNSRIVRASATRPCRSRPGKRMKLGRSPIRNPVRSSAGPYRLCKTSTLNIITASIGGRPPFERSDRSNDASGPARNISKSTTEASRSSASPIFERAAYRSSRSNSPGE